MKLKFYDRLVLFFGALLTIVAGTALTVTGLQVAGTIGESLSLGNVISPTNSLRTSRNTFI